MNGCRRAMGRDCIASRATRPKSMSVLRHAVVKRSRKDIGPLSRSTIEGRHPDTSRFFRYEPDCRRPQRRCLVSSCVKIGAPTMRALNDHRKFRSGGAIVGAGLVGLVPESVLELILGLALAYSTLVTLRQLNVEIPAEPRVDPLAMSFADGGHGEEEPDAHVAEPRPEIGGGRAARRGDDGDDAGAHRVAQVDAVEHGEDRYEHDAAAEAEDRADRPCHDRGGEDGGEEEPRLHLQSTRNGGGSPPPWCVTLIALPRNRSISRQASTRYQLRKKPMLAMKPAWALSRPNSSSATHAATSPNRVRPWSTMAAWMARGASPSGDDVPVQTSSSLHWSFQARGGVSETEATDRCPPRVCQVALTRGASHS